MFDISRSDLNINAFVVNFKIGDKINDDVEELNYLNKAIYYQLAMLEKDAKAADYDMFISSTTFEMRSYGECCSNFKRRIGLEAISEQDLYVLRNVVRAYFMEILESKPHPNFQCMSPFQSAGKFIDKIGEIFQGVVEDRLKASGKSAWRHF